VHELLRHLSLLEVVRADAAGPRGDDLAQDADRRGLWRRQQASRRAALPRRLGADDRRLLDERIFVLSARGERPRLWRALSEHRSVDRAAEESARVGAAVRRLARRADRAEMVNAEDR